MESARRAPELSAAGRATRVLPFVAATFLTFPLAWIGPPPDQDLGPIVGAAAIWTAVAVLIVVLPWWRLPNEAHLVPVAGYCLGVALLRHSGGGVTGGYGGLLLLPIIYQAVYARWRDVVATIACSTITLAAPIVLFGGSAYPVTEWRRVVLSTMTFTVAGLVVSRLVERVTRQKRMFGQVIELTRDLDGPNVQARVCDAIQEATEADLVTFLEVGPSGRIEATIADTGAAAVAVEPHELVALPPDVQAVIDSGTACFIADLAAHPDIDQVARAALGIVSVHHQPVVRAGEVHAVISVGWRKPVRRLDDDVAEAVELLAAEAAVAIERSRLVAQLDRLAHHDQLTGVFNRLAWDEAFTRELARADRTGESATLALLDLDRFKAYNDTHGHLVGDQLLKGATARWAAELRAIDVLARWGGEEFVLLLPATDVAAAAVVLDRLRAVTPEGQSFSAGVVAIDGRAAHDLLRAADAALYRAKAAGRARTVVAEPVLGPA